MDIYEEILRLKRDGRPSALATIVQCIGSSPQKEGSKMLVREDGSIMGTLGGGCMEAEVIQASLMTIRDGRPVTFPFELTERHGGLVCGGKVLVYIEPLVPEPDIFILGAGHVGKALAKAARFCGFRVTVADDRPEYANRENIPDASEIVVRDFNDVFCGIVMHKGSYIVIATRGHNHDLDALRSALRTKAGYVGLLGSRRKRAVLFKVLKEEGFSDEDIGRVIIPVGLPIGSVTPEEISVSIMAQIIQSRRENGPSDLGRSSCRRIGTENGEVEAASSSQ
jgi:xanthine dehydrogenase accessory factor